LAQAEIHKLNIRFLPDDITVSVSEGISILEAALAAGVTINTSCGGVGTCGSCRVWLKEGKVRSKPGAGIKEADYNRGLRLACQSHAVSDITVEIPVVKANSAVTGRSPSSGRRETSILAEGWAFKPMAEKIYLEMQPPTLEDNQADIGRLRRSLKQHGVDQLAIGYDILKQLPAVLRESNWKATATVLAEEPSDLLVLLESGDTSGNHYGIAVDIGTTAVRAQLLDLTTGTTSAESTAYNRQADYGEDVISRIAYSRRKMGMERLQQAISETLNYLIDEMISLSKVEKAGISHIVIAANTVMTQLLLGINPEPLRLSPYVPAVDILPQLKARTLGIDLPEHVYAYIIPSVASFVGGDIVSGITGSGIYQRDNISLYIDIGTNGEIVAGNKDWLVTAACSAGPTFEGGGIKFGMLAASGAIEGFELDAAGGKPEIKIIGDTAPAGICGSGIINAVATLLRIGVLGQNGKFIPESGCHRIRQGPDGLEYLLADASLSEHGQDIVLTEMDVDNFIRSKAAIFAGCQTLIESVGINLEDIDDVIIAGTFGSRIDIENSITVGLLPDLTREKFYFIGNGSLIGARLTCLSQDLYRDGLKVSEMMTNIELSENNVFTNNYIASLFMPHTDHHKFPSVEVGR